MFEGQLYVFKNVCCIEKMRGKPLKVVWKPPCVFVMHAYAPECISGENCLRIRR